MQLFSTKKYAQEGDNENIVNSEIKPLDYESIFAKGWGNRINCLLIVSAFTDVAFIKDMISTLKKRAYANEKSHLAIYLDETASHYFSNKKISESLDKLARSIRDARNNFDEDSGIFLVKCGALFHSKFFISESKTNCRLVLGSANFTKKAFEKNEEIAIAFDASVDGNAKANKLIKSLKEYVKSLKSWKIGTPPEKEIEIQSVREFFLKGRLYRETKEQDPLRISLSFPDEYLDMLSRRSKENASDAIFDYLEMKAMDSLPLFKIIANAQLNFPSIFLKNEKKKHISWKNYCIESCFGYWAPNEYAEQKINDVLDNTSGNKNEKITELVEFVKNNFKTLQDSFVDIIMKFQIDRQHNCIGSWAWDGLNRDEIVKKWETWWQKISLKLCDDKYAEFKERLCRGVACSCVPDIWDDPVSADEFEHSVCESIRYNLSLKDRTSKKICNKIKEQMIVDYKKLTDDILEKITDEDLLEYLLCCNFKETEENT